MPVAEAKGKHQYQHQYQQKADPTKVIAFRRGNPFATLQEIATTSHITRERVRQILARADIATKAEKLPRLCEFCGKPRNHNHPAQYNRRYCSRACRYRASIAEAIYTNCGKVFELSKSQLFARIKRNVTNNLFCSNYCMGQSHGKNYGFPVHPENIRTPKRSSS